jgi:hypothetical protein
VSTQTRNKQKQNGKESSLSGDVGVLLSDEFRVDGKAEELSKGLTSLLVATTNDEPPAGKRSGCVSDRTEW